MSVGSGFKQRRLVCWWRAAGSVCGGRAQRRHTRHEPHQLSDRPRVFDERATIGKAEKGTTGGAWQPRPPADNKGVEGLTVSMRVSTSRVD